MAMITRSRQLLKLIHATENIKKFNSNNTQFFKKNYVFSFCRQFSHSNEGSRDDDEVDIKSITNGDPELEHKLKVILLEAEVMRQEGKLVPANSYISEAHWKELLTLPSRNARRKMYEYLFKLSKKKENRLAKKIEKRQQFEEYKQLRQQEEETDIPLEEFVQKYDLKHNNMFLRIYETTINHLYNSKLIQAIMYGQKLVVDCGYDVNMTKRENLNCAKQLMLLFAENRLHKEPFDLHFCNANPESVLIQQLHKYIPTMYEKWFPIHIHECSYLDLYPKDQLVYLTPHCREELTEFDYDATYIIGAIVDKVNNEPLSLAKAKKEGIKMAKLPLDKYLQWASGSGKSLTLNQVASILLDVHLTGDWNHALRHVPRRKVVDYSIGENIRKTSDRLKFDRPRTKWTPSSGVSFDNLSYQRKSVTRTLEGEEKNRINVKHFIKDSG